MNDIRLLCVAILIVLLIVFVAFIIIDRIAHQDKGE